MSNDKAIISSLKEIEYDFRALKCMSGILAELLDSSIGAISRYDTSHRITITPDELGHLCFAWNDVVSRSEKLEREFMARLYPQVGEGKQCA